MLDKIKALEPKVMAIISMAPLAAGIAIGYIFRTPIGLLIDLIKAII